MDVGPLCSGGKGTPGWAPAVTPTEPLLPRQDWGGGELGWTKTFKNSPSEL